MNQMEMCPCLVLEAESIDLYATPGNNNPDGSSIMVTLYRPTPETLARLKGMTYGKTFNGLELRDRLDDGSTDTSITHRTHMYVQHSPLRANKTHTQTVMFKRA